MCRNGVVIAILALMLVTVLSSGCTGNNSETNPTVTIASAAIELHKQGFQSYLKGDYPGALDLYNQAIAADPKYTRAWMDKGNALQIMNRSAEAIEAYDVVLARENLAPNVWNNRGKALMATGNYSAARDSFDRAIQQAPEFDEAKQNRDLAQKMLQSRD